MAEDDKPNADMNLRDQYAQYAYGQTVAEVMTNPDRDFSEITNAASRAGLDIVFGEEHVAMKETMQQISSLIEASPQVDIKAIVLELPVEYQELFDPSQIQDMPFEEFLIRLLELDVDSMKHTVVDMLDQQKISFDQAMFFGEKHEDAMQSIEQLRSTRDISVYEPTMIENLAALHEMLIKASEKGIPVIAGDVNRERLIAQTLYKADLMSFEDKDHLWAQGMDDRSDLEYVRNMGIDVDGDGIMIVHRGEQHITDDYTADGDGVPVKGFDDALEEAGRHVVTVSVISEGYEKIVYNDPSDFQVVLDQNGESELVRDDYTQDKTNAFTPD